MKITRHLSITGQVQGVWYRDSMRRKAEELGVAGWVRNLRDGSVEAVAQGGKESVEALVAWAWQGPPAAQVADITVTEAEGDYAGFELRPSV